MVELFRHLFEFDAWANRRIADAIDATPAVDAGAVKKLAHIMAAQDLWMRRLRGLDYTGFNPFPDHPLATVRKQIEDSAHDWTAYFATITDAQVAGKVAYRDTQGGQYETVMRDVLIQLYGHGLHHRGQINLHIRQAGGKPAPVDYMVYVRR